jgi:hypothetical protein
VMWGSLAARLVWNESYRRNNVKREKESKAEFQNIIEDK